MTATASPPSRLPDFSSDFLIRTRPPVVEWVEKHLEFSTRVSPSMPGRVSTHNRPYMREPLADFAKHEVTDITLCWGAQTAKTTTAQLGLAWLIEHDPAPVLWVMPTEAMGRSWSSTRFQPFINDNACLARHKPANSDEFKILEMQFDRMTMNVVGSNSPANLASRPIAYLFCDEVCKFAKATKNEASALSLAEQRTKTFNRVKRVKTSTPTIVKDEFWDEFLAGDQRYYNVPCPHCQKKFVFSHDEKLRSLRWSPDAKDEQGRWDLNAVYDSAHYVCPHCEGQIFDYHKPRMLLAGEWIATNSRSERGHRSYHLNSFYSPDVTFGKMASEFLKAKEQLFGLQDYLNGWLALPWSDDAAEIEEKHLLAKRQEYALGTCPCPTPAAILLGADVQQSFTNYIVRAFAADGESWLLDYGRFASVDDLTQWAAAQRYTVGGKELKISAGMIDSGYATEHVYRACMAAAKLGIKFIPSKGSGERFLTKPIRITEMCVGGRTYKNSLVIYSDADFKRILYLDCIRDSKRPWWIPSACGLDYTEELLREKMVTLTNTRGYEQIVWKRFGANHYADAEKLALVMWMAH